MKFIECVTEDGLTISINLTRVQSFQPYAGGVVFNMNIPDYRIFVSNSYSSVLDLIRNAIEAH